MTNPRKSRVTSASVSLLNGIFTSDGTHATYYMVDSYDKKGRKIPSSVQCLFNSDYYSYDDILLTAQAL